MSEPAPGARRRILGDSSPPGWRPAAGAKYAELIADELRKAIVRDAEVGDQLPSERELIERFQVSRPTLREAMRILETEGLLEIKRGARGGAVVARPSMVVVTKSFGVYLQRHATALRDIFEARQVIEPAVVRAAAASGSADLGPLDQILDRGPAAPTDDSDVIGRMEIEFHNAILALSPSFTLGSLGGLLGAVAESQAADRRGLMSNSPTAMRELCAAAHREHAGIIAAIRQGDAVRAEKRMVSHLEGVVRMLPAGPLRRTSPIGPY